MGTHTSVSGEMTFSRSLKPAELVPLRPVLADMWNIFKITEEVTREIDEAEGVTITRTSHTGIELMWEDEIKAIGYGWEKVLQRLIEALPPDVTVVGMFQGEVTDGDFAIERLYVDNEYRSVKVVKAEIHWPAAPDGVVA